MPDPRLLTRRETRRPGQHGRDERLNSSPAAHARRSARAFLHRSYNDVPAWRYDALPYAFGGEEGRYFSAAAATEGELSAAIAQAEAAQEGGKLAWVELRTDRLDVAKGCRWLSKNSLCTPEGHAPFAYGAIHK